MREKRGALVCRSQVRNDAIAAQLCNVRYELVELKDSSRSNWQNSRRDMRSWKELIKFFLGGRRRANGLKLIARWESQEDEYLMRGINRCSQREPSMSRKRSRKIVLRSLGDKYKINKARTLVLSELKSGNLYRLSEIESAANELEVRKQIKRIRNETRANTQGLARGRILREREREKEGIKL